MTHNFIPICGLVFLLAALSATPASADEFCNDTTAQQKFSTPTGESIFYIDTARGDASKQRPIVILLHGAKYSHKNWCDIHLVGRLDKEGYRVIAADLPGFGASAGHTAESVILRFASMRSDAGGKFLGQLVTHLNGGKVAIVSPSLSGSFSLPYVAENPGQVAAYIPVAPVSRAMLGQQKTGAEKTLDVPTLHIYGSKDHPRLGLLKHFTQLKEHIIQDAGHACYLDKPKEFNDAVVDFLKQHLPPSATI